MTHQEKSFISSNIRFSLLWVGKPAPRGSRVFPRQSSGATKGGFSTHSLGLREGKRNEITSHYLMRITQCHLRELAGSDSWAYLLTLNEFSFRCVVSSPRCRFLCA